MILFVLNFGYRRTSFALEFDNIEYIDVKDQPSEAKYYLNFWDLKQGDEVAVTYNVRQETEKEKRLANERFPGCLVGKFESQEEDSDSDVVFKFRVSKESFDLVTLAEFVSFFFFYFNDALFHHQVSMAKRAPGGDKIRWKGELDPQSTLLFSKYHVTKVLLLFFFLPCSSLCRSFWLIDHFDPR